MRTTATPRLRALLALLALIVTCGCGEEPAPIDQVQPNAVDKAVFEDSWYMSRTVIGVDYAGSQVGTFPGDIASDAAQDFTVLPRIRWEITEDTLFAYRDYELTQGGQPDDKGALLDDAARQAGDAEGLMGQPVAAYTIESHFDIQRAYNTRTGEERNVIEENDSDRRWYERAFMRVDWSKNLLPAYFGQSADMQSVFGYWKREPAASFAQGASDLPASWAPQFHRMGCDDLDDEGCPAHERDLAGDYDRDELYHMSFVSQEILSPDAVPDALTGQPINWCVAEYYNSVPACTAVVSHVRTAFLKVSDRRQYEPVNWSDTRFERFGYFRLSQDVVDRSTGKADDPAYGYTDFLNYNVHRHNIWQQWHDEDGAPLPFDERQVRKVVWYTTPELPAHLVYSSFDVVSQWNEVLMGTVRRLRGQALPSYPAVDCQTDAPDGYCYCQVDAQSGEPLQATCPGQYDPFTAPDALPDGTTRAYDCYVEVPEGAEPDTDRRAVSDADFNGWFGARMVGSECVNVLRINDCNRDTIADNDGTRSGLACQERGDLRFKFLSYVDQPGTGFLGIATLRGDPETGEIIAGDANIGGPALDGFRTSALETYDLIQGNIDERDVVTGEDIRSYLSRLGQVQLPAQPRYDFSVATRSEQTGNATASTQRAALDGTLDRAADRLSRLRGSEGRANTFSDRRSSFIGGALERKLMSGTEGLVQAGFESLGSAPPELTEVVLDRASPFRNDVHAMQSAAALEERKRSRANVMLPNAYVDDSVQWFVTKHADWSRARLEFGLNRLLYRQTQLHELGHCMGLRHDFGASADTDHYHPNYYAIDAAHPLPDPGDYDLDGTQGLSVDEQLEFERDLASTRSARELSGIDGAMTSSVMDYSANWYQRLQPLGRYDRAAIAFAYGDLVEAYEGAPQPTTARAQLKYYQGGETCGRDSDCPYAQDGERAGELLDGNLDAGLTQRCEDNPRTPGEKLCSNFDGDIAALGDASLRPLSYRFCTDSRADSTLPWCNRFDEGDSFREMVRNVAEDYERGYIFNAFRRYNRNFSIGGYASRLLGRRMQILQNIYYDLLYQVTAQPASARQDGPFGIYDQFLATTDILNFYGRILAQPRIDNYAYQAATDSYVPTGSPEPADLEVPLGLGRYYSSSYQRGLSGFERIERIGSFYDKAYVMQLLTFRGMRPEYTPDLAFYANFYDLFPVEIGQMFGGIIRGFPDSYSARVVCDNGERRCDDPRIVYMDLYRGDCSDPATCRPDPAASTYGAYPVLDGGSSLNLQIYATLYALTEFPIYYDTSFQNQLFVCVEGQGECFEPAPGDVEGIDYARYTSDYYLKSFLARNVAPKAGLGGATAIGFSMVQEARDLEVAERALVQIITGPERYALANLSVQLADELTATGYIPPDTPAEIDAELQRVTRRLRQLESFFNQLIEIQRTAQIYPAFYWGGSAR